MIAFPFYYDCINTDLHNVKMESFPFYNSLFLIETWYPLKIFKHIQIIDCSKDSLGEGNGSPLQYSCLENPMDRGTWWAAVHGVAKSWTRLSDFTSLTSLTSYFITGEGNGNPLQYSCLENPMDGGAWRAKIHGVAESWTRLKWLSTHTCKDSLGGIVSRGWPKTHLFLPALLLSYSLKVPGLLHSAFHFVMDMMFLSSPLEYANCMFFFNGSLAACSVPVYLDFVFSCLFWSVSFWWFGWPS